MSLTSSDGIDACLPGTDPDNVIGGRYPDLSVADLVGPGGLHDGVDNTASAVSTVVEVRAPDRGPVLYQVGNALAASGVTITRALVNTLGAEALDVFYVQTVTGSRVDDPASQERLIATVTRALLSNVPD